MTVLSEKPQEKRLSGFGLRIVTSFWDEHAVRQRASDRSVRDDIVDGVIMNKKYYREGRLLHTETEFSPLLHYSFLVQNELDQEIRCPNCGFGGKVAEFENGCPFCGTSCNIAYSDRKSAGKLFAEKKARRFGQYLVPFLLFLAGFMGLGVLAVRVFGRTFGRWDILKGLAFGLVAGLGAFYAWYVRRIAWITRADEEKYSGQIARIRAFEKRLSSFGITMNQLYNSLNSELTDWFFGGNHPEYADVADWDVLDYDQYAVSGETEEDLAVRLTARLRILRMKGDRLRSGETVFRAEMRPNPETEDRLHPGVNIVHCRLCGAAIDVTKPACGRGGAPVRYRQRLYLTKLD